MGRQEQTAERRRAWWLPLLSISPQLPTQFLTKPLISVQG